MRRTSRAFASQALLTSSRRALAGLRYSLYLSARVPFRERRFSGRVPFPTTGLQRWFCNNRIFSSRYLHEPAGPPTPPAPRAEDGEPPLVQQSGQDFDEVIGTRKYDAWSPTTYAHFAPGASSGSTEKSVSAFHRNTLVRLSVQISLKPYVFFITNLSILLARFLHDVDSATWIASERRRHAS